VAVLNNYYPRFIKKTIGALLMALCLIYLYTLLHEGGHALVEILYGGEIEKFVLGFNAHVTYYGANFTQFGLALCNAAGVLFPAICLCIALIFYNRKIKNVLYHYIYYGMTIGIAGSLLAWIVIPVISLYAAPPAGDDVTKFLMVTGMNPLIVSALALLLMGSFLFIAYKKGLFAKFKEFYSMLKSEQRN